MWYRVHNTNGEFEAQKAEEPSFMHYRWRWQKHYWSDGGISCYCNVFADGEEQAIWLAKAIWSEAYTGRGAVNV